jgi:tetratricopeptide (TPR) repeat protein
MMVLEMPETEQMSHPDFDFGSDIGEFPFVQRCRELSEKAANGDEFAEFQLRLINWKFSLLEVQKILDSDSLEELIVNLTGTDSFNPTLAEALTIYPLQSDEEKIEILEQIMHKTNSSFCNYVIQNISKKHSCFEISPRPNVTLQTNVTEFCFKHRCEELYAKCRNGDLFAEFKRYLLKSEDCVSKVEKILDSNSLEELIINLAGRDSFNKTLCEALISHPLQSDEEKIEILKKIMHETNLSFCLYTIASIYEKKARSSGPSSNKQETQLQLAKQYYEYLDELDPNYQNCRIKLAALHELSGDYREAIRLYALNCEKVLHKIPYETETLLELMKKIREHAAKREFKEALKELENAKRNPEIVEELKRIVLDIDLWEGEMREPYEEQNLLGLFDRTIESLKNIESAPDSLFARRLHLVLAEAYEGKWYMEQDRGYLEKAYQAYKASGMKDIHSTEILRRFAGVARRLGKFNDAYRAFERIEKITQDEIRAAARNLDAAVEKAYSPDFVPPGSHLFGGAALGASFSEKDSPEKILAAMCYNKKAEYQKLTAK